ncbi:MAG: hypothetical protein KGJ86_17415, partial [Chloroflexota bacterium]|nr:hypothetical protein [Chloroflexota bacterium]
MKLGPHVIQTTAAALAWAARAPTVKQLDGTAALRLALSGAMTIYRRYWPDDVQNRRIAAGAVDETVQDILEGLEGFRPSYVELFNEVAQLLGAGLEEHADFVTGAADRLHRQGLKVLAFSFSTGNPGPGEWQYLRSRGFCGADAVGLHEYWGAAGLTPWHGLRHRLAHQWTAGQHPPFVVTECGRDAVDGGGGGWLSSNLEASQYLAELAAYDAAVSQDPYV